jgi:hypothetical protein
MPGQLGGDEGGERGNVPACYRGYAVSNRVGAGGCESGVFDGRALWDGSCEFQDAQVAVLGVGVVVGVRVEL